MQSSSVSNQKTAATKPTFPVDSLLPQIIESLKSNTLLLLEASSGAGKTTRVPAALFRAGYEHIYVLEPRRLAARMAAQRVSREFAEPLGHTIGYQVRFQEVSTRATKVWYLTEGILTRQLLAASDLPGVRVVILDEFHERHLETDLALSLLLRLQLRRPELKLILMSATLGADQLRAQLGSPPLLQSIGRAFPVSISYTPHSAAPLEEQVAVAVNVALKQTRGDILVFLPGAAEIRKAMQACEPLARSFNAALCALHGDLTAEEQDRAVRPGVQRKIVCSTNVAESSVTIEGIEAVIDSGLARVLTHSSWSGLSSLRVEKASQASVIQRSGRAGRTAPGIAIRLFPESDFIRRPAHISPEILRADLAPALLQLTAGNIRWQDLTWLHPPPPDNLQAAQELLHLLAAVDASGRITPTGRQMARLPLHPRLARFLIAAAQAGVLRDAADLAARLTESRFRPDDRAHSAFATDLDAILAAEPSFNTRTLRQQLVQAARNVSTPSPDPQALEKALLLAYPDRVAKKRGETLLLANGGGAKLDRRSHASGDFVIALEVDDRSDQSSALVRIAVQIKPDWLLDAFPDEIQTSEELVWNREAERVEQRNLIRYRQLTLDESSSPPRHSPQATLMLIAKALEAGIERLTDAEALSRFMLRLRFASGHGNFDVPPHLLEQALTDLANGAVSFAELRVAARDNAFLTLLEAHLPMRIVDQVAPTHITLPSGRRAPIEYHDGRSPSVASRLQDFFGMQTSPTVARGTVPLVVQLLAPNQRPVQVTTDLASFWKNLYPQVRRELSRRYPRHSWPENPA